MLIRLLIIAAIGGLAYFLVNRAPLVAPTVKAVVKWVILAVTCLLILGELTGRHLLGRLG